MYKLNLTDSLNYSITLPLSDGGRALRLELSYNRFGDLWSMSLYDNLAEEYIISHAPLLLSQNETIICGVLKQMQYLGIGDFFVLMKEKGSTEKNPRYLKFNENFDLFWME